jgi:D-alanyl-D-alanine carboxypeptidase (penicillin-binding protein 5/6)
MRTNFPSNPNKTINSDELLFVSKMNATAKKLGMVNTKYGNVHGVWHENNYSTCIDQCILIKKCWKLDLFRELVRTENYTGWVTKEDGDIITVDFVQTNKMVADGYAGIKTGVTEYAGPCLATLKQIDNKQIVVVLLKASSMDNRFKDAYSITDWVLGNYGEINKISEQMRLSAKKKTN